MWRSEGADVAVRAYVGPRVLLVDDNHYFRDGLRALLEDYRIEVVGEATTGVEALVLAEELRPEVVLMDLRMPEMDGVNATRELRSRHPEIEVILLSAYEEQALQQDAQEAGARAFLIKGSDASLILDAVLDASGD